MGQFHNIRLFQYKFDEIINVNNYHASGEQFPPELMILAMLVH